MKINVMVSAIIMSTVVACSSPTEKKKMDMTEEEPMTKQEPKMDSNHKMDKKHTVSLKKGELFIVIYADQKEGTDELLQDYFKKVFPSAQKNGFTPLGKFLVDGVAAGNFNPSNFVGIYKWPNAESVQGFFAEISPEELTQLRVKIWDELKQNMIMVPEDVSFTVQENKVYEVKALWNDEAVKVDEIIENGGKIVVNNTVDGYEDLGKNEAPTQILIVEWENKAKAESFKSMNVFEVNNEEAFYTHFDFSEQK